MMTSQLRAALKEVEPRARVSSIGEGLWTIRTADEPTIVRAYIKTLGLEEIDYDIEGAQHDWTYVLTIASPKGRKKP